jgi:hypothetical protein
MCGGALMAPVRAERLFGEDVLVSGEPVGMALHMALSAGQHGIVAIGDTVFVAWQGVGPEGYRVYVSRSCDAGSTFSEPVRVNDSDTSACYPSIAIDRLGVVYVGWNDRRSGEEHVYISKSTDRGLTFGPDVLVDDAGSDPGWRSMSSLAVDDSGRIYAAWIDKRGNGGTGGVYFSKSLDGGATFSANTALPNLESGWPQMAVSVAAVGDGHAYISYVDYRHVDDNPNAFVVVRHTWDAGETFSAPVDVESYTCCDNTSICAPVASSALVSWIMPGGNVYVARSIDGGISFEPGIEVSSRQAHDPFTGTVSISSCAPHMIGVSWKDSLGVLAYAESWDEGTTFDPPVYLRGPADMRYPTLTMRDCGDVFLAWTDFRNGEDPDVYCCRGYLDPPAGTPGAELRLPRLVVSPNPFRIRCAVSVEWGEALTSIDVYDPRGRLVRALRVFGEPIEWDGKDGQGRKVSPGIYILKARDRRAVRCEKAVLSR